MLIDLFYLNIDLRLFYLLLIYIKLVNLEDYAVRTHRVIF